jgi:histidinol phosphatase-like enzyme (inositol monophosphatase family)
MSPRLAFAVEAAYRAGRLTLQYFQTGVQVETKSDETPVTAADKGAERLIRELIAEKYPDDAILGEEEGGSQAPDRWVIDPIDGTKSFVSGVPLYATLLSYEVAGAPVLGVCYFPALDEMLYAETGQGAFCNGRSIAVSGKSVLEGSVFSCGGLSSMKKYGRADGFEKISDVALATRSWSDAYGHALVATGRIEAMVDPIVNPWDISAVSLIVREAGGRFTDFSGNDALGAEAISSNGHVHARVLEVFQG